MAENKDPLRIIAAIILGIITGGLLFLIAAIGLGIINDRLRMNLSISLDIAENVFSAALLVLFIGLCIAFFYWKVATTPPTVPEPEEGPEGGD